MVRVHGAHGKQLKFYKDNAKERHLIRWIEVIEGALITELRFYNLKEEFVKAYLFEDSPPWARQIIRAHIKNGSLILKRPLSSTS